MNKRRYWPFYALMFAAGLIGALLMFTPNSARAQQKEEPIVLTEEEAQPIKDLQSQIDLLIEKQKVAILTVANNHKVSMKTHRMLSRADNKLVLSPLDAPTVVNGTGSIPAEVKKP